MTLMPVLDELANIKRQKGEVDLQLEFMNKKYLQLKDDNANLQHNEVCSIRAVAENRLESCFMYCACQIGINRHSTLKFYTIRLLAIDTRCS